VLLCPPNDNLLSFFCDLHIIEGEIAVCKNQ
jgi:hypothetical protein